MYFWCFGFRGELGFLNCDDVCMCVVNKQFELLEFVSESVYVDLQYDEISLTFTAGPVCLCGVSSPVVVLGGPRQSWHHNSRAKTHEGDSPLQTSLYCSS